MNQEDQPQLNYEEDELISSMLLPEDFQQQFKMLDKEILEKDAFFDGCNNFENLDQHQKQQQLFNKLFQQFTDQNKITKQMLSENYLTYKLMFYKYCNPNQLVQNQFEKLGLNQKEAMSQIRQQFINQLQFKAKLQNKLLKNNQNAYSHDHLNKLFQNKECFIKTLEKMYYMPNYNNCDWNYLSNYLTCDEKIFKIQLPVNFLKKYSELTVFELHDTVETLLSKKKLPVSGFTHEKPANKQFYLYILQQIDPDDTQNVYKKLINFPYNAVVDDVIYKLFDQDNLNNNQKAKLLKKNPAEVLDNYCYEIQKKQNKAHLANYEAQNEFIGQKEKQFQQNTKIQNLKQDEANFRFLHPEIDDNEKEQIVQSFSLLSLEPKYSKFYNIKLKINQ